MRLAILVPQQLQRQVLPLAELLVHRGEIDRLPAGALLCPRRTAVQSLLQLLLIQALWQRPAQPGCLRLPQQPVHGSQGHAARPRDLPLGPAALMVQPQDILDQMHFRDSPSRHLSAPFREGAFSDARPHRSAPAL